MRRTFAAAFLAALVAGACPIAAGAGTPEVRYDGHKVVRVLLDSAQDVQTMLVISGDHWSEGPGPGLVDYRVTPEGLEALRATTFPFQVMVEDVQALIDAERERLAGQGGAAAGGNWFLDYKTYTEVNLYFDTLVKLRPGIAETFTVGSSLEGLPIHGIRITGPGEDKPAVLLNGCQHAREWIAVMVPMYVADRLVRDYDTDPEIQSLVDQLEFLIVPIVNPDGYVYSWGPDRLWRKNRRNNGDGSFGVDLNRNWDYEWGGEGSSGSPGSETYRGTAPFSEPETQVLRNFYLANPQIVTNIDFHSYSQLVLWPWGWTLSPPPDEGLLDGLGADMSASILSVHGETYVQGQVYPTLYPAAGVSIDWAYGDQGVFSYTIELRPDSPDPGFILPPQEIIPNGEEAFAAVLDLAAFSLQGPLFSFPSGLPSIVESDTPTVVEVDVATVGLPLAPGSEDLYSRIGTSGAFAASPLVPLGGGSYQGTLPAAGCGQVIQYYFEVQTTDGAFHRSPDGAPAEHHDADVFAITVAFADDFQADQGWTTQNGGGLTDGAWDRGVPVDCDRGDPPADADGSGQAALTDNSAANQCNSDVDGGSTNLVSPVMDASDPTAVISYYRWYSNTAGADPFNDVFVVEVSDDAGASWTQLEAVGPAGPEVDGGWFLREYLVADIPGIDNSAQFRIRFNASDLINPSVVEAGVDGVALRAFGCPSQGADLDGNGSVGIGDLLILLGSWGPCPQPPAACPADLDGDGAVGISDLLILLSQWG